LRGLLDRLRGRSRPKNPSKRNFEPIPVDQRGTRRCQDAAEAEGQKRDIQGQDRATRKYFKRSRSDR
jgi:hypothetical protein